MSQPPAPSKSVTEAADELGKRVDRLRSSLRRHRAWNVAVGVALVLSLWSSWAARLNTRSLEEAADNRRVYRSGQQYAGCLVDNGQTEAMGRTFDNLFLTAAASPPQPGSTLTREQRLTNLSRTLDVLRGELRVYECEAFLADLSPDERARARAVAAEIPRRPLPPPDLPGYVPPTTTPD